MASETSLSNAALERLLVDVGAHLDDPQPVALALRVRARVGEEPQKTRVRWPRVAVVGFALVAAMAIVLGLSSDTRDAVADWLGLRGVSIEQRDDRPPTKLGADLALGDATTLEDARTQADFGVLVPRDLGSPDEVYVADAPSGTRVTLLFDAGDDLPPAAASGVGLLLTEFRADVPDEVVRKIVSSGVRLDEVSVDVGRGYWFEGEPHVLSFVDAEGHDFTEQSRLAGNTLIWERGSLTLRLESGLSRGDAIRVAESLTAQP